MGCRLDFVLSSKSKGFPWVGFRFLLRLFGAKIAPHAHPHPSAKIWAPWNLEMGEYSCLSHEVDCYCVDRIKIGPHATVSQYSYLCTATHDIEHPHMPLVTAPIEIGAGAWVTADVFVGPGVTIGEGAVIGARSSVFRDVPPWTVAAGNPAREIRKLPHKADMISALVLTLNEELNLAACLESLCWCDDVVVFDSFSSDRTLEIAKSFKARVVQRRFDNERDHRAASLKVPFKYGWVYNPDADEITTPALRHEMVDAVRNSARPEVAYRVRFKTIFLGRWIKHSSLYPTWVVRLFRPETVTFERVTNLRYVINGPVGQLENHFEHYTFNKGLDAWFDKHNQYSAGEARESIQSLARVKPNTLTSWRKTRQCAAAP